MLSVSNLQSMPLIDLDPFKKNFVDQINLAKKVDEIESIKILFKLDRNDFFLNKDYDIKPVGESKFDHKSLISSLDAALNEFYPFMNAENQLKLRITGRAVIKGYDHSLSSAWHYSRFEVKDLERNLYTSITGMGIYRTNILAYGKAKPYFKQILEELGRGNKSEVKALSKWFSEA